MLPEQGFECSLTNNRKNHLAHDAIGVADSSFSDAEQNAGLSAYLAVFLEERFNDPPFSPNRDAVVISSNSSTRPSMISASRGAQ